MSRELFFLKHLGRYRLSLPRIAAAHFFTKETWKAAIAKLRKEGRIQVCGLGRPPHGFSYIQLTVAEAKRMGVPEHRARPLHGALHKNLSVLWFCFGAPPHGRMRLEPHEYPVDVLGPAPNTKEPLCVENSPEGDRCVRVLVPGSTASLEHTIRTVKDEAFQLLKHPRSHEALRTGQLRFVVLVEIETRRQQVLEAFRPHLVGPLAGVRVHAELAPGPTTLRSFLKSS